MESLLRQDWNVANLESCFPRSWSVANMNLHTLMKWESRYLLVRYEDLVRHPEEHLATICAHLGLPYEDGMRDPAKRSPELTMIPHLKKLENPISSEWIGAHRSRLSTDQIRSFEKQAREALITFGYGTDPMC
jgi:hypothetical protein